MDFLDPKRKKAHRQRLLIGYVLMAIALAMGTLILLFSAYGYDIDRKTGSVIQNGTVFVDSQPGGSSIDLDGVRQNSKTASRLALPGSRQYTIKLTNDGYEDWTRTFSLEGGQIERLTYPLLIPKQLETKDTQLYAAAPGLSSQSPDRRWLLVQQPGAPLSFDMYDLNSPSASPVAVTIPTNLLSESAVPSTITVVEWADDNHHVLFNREYAGKHEFLVIDTESSTSGVNINSSLGIVPSDVRLRDKKPDQFYLYTAEGGILRGGDTKNRTISAPILSGVLAYKSYADNMIMYATKEGAATGDINIRVRENDKGTYLLAKIPESPSYLLDISQYDGTPYYIVGNAAADAVFVYRDPLPILKGQGKASLLVSSVLRIESPAFVSFSASSQFVAVQNVGSVTVLDLENDRQFKIDLKRPLATATKIPWMDGHRLAFVDSGMSYIIDFDGSNERKLVPSLAASGPYFSPDFRIVFTLASSASVSGRFAFTQTSLVKK